MGSSARHAAGGEPNVTVVVCAYTDRRWDDIRSALAGVARQTVQPRQTLLVIDHNPDLLERARAEFPGLTVIANERRQGLSGARNTAIVRATGDIVAFLDDDATPEPRWLELLLAAYDEHTYAVGGSAVPVWPNGAAPANLPTELAWVVGCTYRGQPTERTAVRNLMGCNMSFRREVFAVAGDFAEDVGRIGTIPLGCEETELCIRLTQRRPDARIVFEPAATVHHRVSSDRLGWDYLRRRSYAEGLSKAYISTLVGAGDATAAERSYVRRILPSGAARELRRAAGGDVGRGLRGLLALAISLTWAAAGYVRGRMTPAHAGRRGA